MVARTGLPQLFNSGPARPGNQRKSADLLRLDGDLHISVRPAALEPAATLARLVVGLDTKEIVAGRGKRRRGRDHIALLGHWDSRLVECDLPRPTEFVKRNRCNRRRAPPASAFLIRSLRIFDPHTDGHRFVDLAREGRRYTDWRSSDLGAALRKREHRRLVSHAELFEGRNRVPFVQA